MPTIPKTFNKDNPRFDKNPNDFFETPIEIATKCLWTMIRALPDGTSCESLIDVGCGNGVWGKAANKVFDYPMSFGIDIQQSPLIDSTLLTPEPYDFYDVADYLTFDYNVYRENHKFDLIIGNPPYSSKDNRYLVNDIITHSFDLLTNNGYIGMLLKTEFLASQRRYDTIFKNHAPLFMYQLIPRPYWTNYTKGTNTIEYAFYVWQKQENVETKVRWLNWKQ